MKVLFAVLSTGLVQSVLAQQCNDTPGRCIIYKTDSPVPRPTDGSCPQSPAPTIVPSAAPTLAPKTPSPTDKASDKPTSSPTDKPTPSPTDKPTPSPTDSPTRSPTDAPITPIEAVHSVDCSCGDKSNAIVGEGKVTGGGWILLQQNEVYFDESFCTQGTQNKCEGQWNDSLEGIKANYGFNAMYRKGLPEGSTNFGFDGAYFHFHSETHGTPLKFLEVIDGIHARWMGKGWLSTKLKPKRNDWADDYCFMVAVQDHGEPGYHDTWRIRIWYCGDNINDAATSNCLDDELPLDSLTPHTHDFLRCGDDEVRLVFDTNQNQKLPSAGFQKPANENSDTELRFDGTEVGVADSSEDGAKGGGNIQIHKSNVKSKALQYLEDTGGECGCNNATYPDDGDGCNGFVTGGGWIILTDRAYLKDASCVCGDNMGICDTDDNTNCNALGQVDKPKANFGFNAKAFHGEPDGSTNFDIDGNGFHFKTSTGGGAQYDGLEVVCNDNTYGGEGNGVYARWTGIGRVAWTTGNPNGGDWVDGYRFFVTAQDYGEPGLDDTFRIRILDLDNSILFDSDYEKNHIYDIDPWYTPEVNADFDPDFSGNSLGGEGTAHGGGNIQVHCKGGPPTQSCTEILPQAAKVVTTPTSTPTSPPKSAKKN